MGMRADMEAGARSSFIGTMIGSSFVSGGTAPAISYADSPITADVDDVAAIAVTVTAGTQPFTYAVNSGALPDGLSIDANTGEITGTYTTQGAFTAVIRATDGAARTGDATVNWTVLLVSLGFFTNAGYCANEYV